VGEGVKRGELGPVAKVESSHISGNEGAGKPKDNLGAPRQRKWGTQRGSALSCTQLTDRRRTRRAGQEIDGSSSSHSSSTSGPYRKDREKGAWSNADRESREKSPSRLLDRGSKNLKYLGALNFALLFFQQGIFEKKYQNQGEQRKDLR